MKKAIATAGGAAALLLTATGSFAQGVPGNPQRGHEFASRLCINCHVVDGAPAGPVSTDVPSFSVIAGRPGATPEHIAGRIIIPHPAMPGVSLTAAEIRDIVAYITGLRRTN